MHVKSLKVLCDVVAHRSFSKAARENGISQSHVSQLVHQLEARLGVTLLDRSKRPFVLTAEGDLFYKGCRRLVDRFHALEEEVRTLNQEISGQVRVAAIYSAGLSHANRAVRDFLAANPRANVRVEYQHPDRVYQLVQQDRVDVGLVSYPKSTRQVRAIPWFDEPMVVVCGPDHSLSGRSEISPADLHGLEMVSFDDGLRIRKQIDRFLEQAGVEVVIGMEFDNTETLKGAIEIGAGFGLLPYPTVAREVDLGALVAIPLAGPRLVRPLGLLTRRGKSHSRTTRRFLEFLFEFGKSETSRLWSSAATPVSGAEADKR